MNKINAPAGAATGFTAALDLNNHLQLTGADADTPVTVGLRSTATLLTEAGLSVGTTDPTNLLTQGAVAHGQTLTVTIGSATTTITFGNCRAGLHTGGSQLAAQWPASITGGTASADSHGNITITATNPNDQITLDGGVVTANEAANFGIRPMTAQPSDQKVVANDVTTFLNEFGRRRRGHRL